MIGRGGGGGSGEAEGSEASCRRRAGVSRGGVGGGGRDEQGGRVGEKGGGGREGGGGGGGGRRVGHREGACPGRNHEGGPDRGFQDGHAPEMTAGDAVLVEMTPRTRLTLASPRDERKVVPTTGKKPHTRPVKRARGGEGPFGRLLWPITQPKKCEAFPTRTQEILRLSQSPSSSVAPATRPRDCPGPRRAAPAGLSAAA